MGVSLTRPRIPTLTLLLCCCTEERDLRIPRNGHFHQHLRFRLAFQPQPEPVVWDKSAAEGGIGVKAIFDREPMGSFTCRSTTALGRSNETISRASLPSKVCAVRAYQYTCNCAIYQPTGPNAMCAASASLITLQINHTQIVPRPFHAYDHALYSLHPTCTIFVPPCASSTSAVSCSPRTHAESNPLLQRCNCKPDLASCP